MIAEIPAYKHDIPYEPLVAWRRITVHTPFSVESECWKLRPETMLNFSVFLHH